MVNSLAEKPQNGAKEKPQQGKGLIRFQDDDLSTTRSQTTPFA